MLCDAGPLVAMIDADDPNHQLCMDAVAKFRATTFFTTWPCLTEAMYLLNRAAGIAGQNGLWRFLSSGTTRLVLLGEADWPAMNDLMNRYADLPLDFADASLIVAAERINDWALFSIDAKLRAVRPSEGQWLEVFP
jgi:predicted nucleic acid-binding protein